METGKVFDYLLVPEVFSADACKLLTQDYWNSTVEMNSENRHSGKDYRCCVVCVGYTREQRKRLSDRTGIPLGRIMSIDRISGRVENSIDFATCVGAGLMHNNDFLGRIKIYASEQKIPREILAPAFEVVYAE